jgi:hypothetical protein
MILRTLLFVALAASLTPSVVFAKPVTWEGGHQAMFMNDQDMNALHYHYTFDPKTSVQTRTDYLRDNDTLVVGVQVDRLLKRWNMPNAQGNIYGALGGGYARTPDAESPALFGNILADYETRRFLVSYENDFVTSDDVMQQFWHRTRIGFAPYEGEYNDIHTWLMLQTDYRPDMNDEVSVTPMIRLFKTNWMLEAGITHRGDGMLNFIIQY